MEAVVAEQYTRSTDVRGTAIQSGEYVSAAEFMSAVEQLRSEAAANGLSGMTMEEIDDEIAACRRDRRTRQGK